MNIPAPLRLGRLVWTEGPLVSRNMFTALLIILAACSATARFSLDQHDAIAAVMGGIRVNKVTWLCLGIAVWHLCRCRSTSVSAQQLAAAVPALFLSAFAGGLLSWIGLSISLLVLLYSAGTWGEARSGLLLALGVALHQVLVEALAVVGGDAILGVEADVVGLLAGAFISGLEVQGNAIQTGAGHMVVLVWGCSSLTNLGSALLLFWALVSIRIPVLQCEKRRRLFVSYAVLLGCATVFLNILRLSLMASEYSLYEFLHTSDGAGLFRLATLGLTAVMGMTVLSR